MAQRPRSAPVEKYERSKPEVLLTATMPWTARIAEQGFDVGVAGALHMLDGVRRFRGDQAKSR